MKCGTESGHQVHWEQGAKKKNQAREENGKDNIG
jgi:hypothetical protein